MATRSKLAVILHADVVGSTALVQRDERVVHHRIQDAFRHLSETIASYAGTTHELRGDALVGEFERASDAVSAATIPAPASRTCRLRPVPTPGERGGGWQPGSLPCS